MYLDQFVTKYCGKKVDYDEAYGAQCVDLFRQYCKDVLNVPHTGVVDGAKELFEKYPDLPVEKKYFIRLAKRAVPSYGDVAVWGATPTNKFGHTAIVLTRLSSSSLLVFEQNGVLQDGAKVVERDTKYLLGYLRLKGGK